jgi:hypothetical protein
MENSYIENPSGVHMLWYPCTHGSYFFEKKQNLIFWWNFKVSSELIVFWIDFGCFGES